MNIVELQASKFPICIITDTHTELLNVMRIKQLYPDGLIVCLGDITILWNSLNKRNDKNKKSLEFFIKSNILCISGNHDEFIANSKNAEFIFDITTECVQYLRNLPKGIKIILPNGDNYLLYHNRPNDSWSFTEYDTLSLEKFNTTYPIDGLTKAVIIGHNHRGFITQYNNCKLICIGDLPNTNEYGLITDLGLEIKKL